MILPAEVVTEIADGTSPISVVNDERSILVSCKNMVIVPKDMKPVHSLYTPQPKQPTDMHSPSIDISIPVSTEKPLYSKSALR